MASFVGNLVTLEYTKKYDPSIYDFVYTPVIKMYTSCAIASKSKICRSCKILVNFEKIFFVQAFDISGPQVGTTVDGASPAVLGLLLFLFFSGLLRWRNGQACRIGPYPSVREAAKS
jgi:hypothetical protein